MKLCLLVITMLMLAGCGNKPAADNKSDKLISLSLNYDKKEISITVVSTGCTGKSDFTFVVKDNTIRIERTKRDECKAVPEAINLVYTFLESGIDADKSYTIVNSFIANPNLANIR